MASRAATAAPLLVLLALLYCCCPAVVGYDYVPVTSLFHVDGATGVKSTDTRTCLSNGGYLASEATALLHTADAQMIESTTGQTVYYAFLGGGIVQAPNMSSAELGFCPYRKLDPAFYVDPVYPQDRGSAALCYWRWYPGRWMEYESVTDLPYDQAHAGIIFYVGIDPSPSMRRYNDFPEFWYIDTGLYAPGMFAGHELVLARSAMTKDVPVWGDSYAQNGYVNAMGFAYNTTAIKETLKYWQLVCQAQGPIRLNYESADTTSALQGAWWAIFFVILFVLCLIVFLVVALCQDREDMDEPPEDAPDWAEKETMQRSVSKRYVSQRSFRAGNDDVSGGASGDTGSSSRASKEDAYEGESEEASAATGRASRR